MTFGNYLLNRSLLLLAIKETVCPHSYGEATFILATSNPPLFHFQGVSAHLQCAAPPALWRAPCQTTMRAKIQPKPASRDCCVSAAVALQLMPTTQVSAGVDAILLATSHDDSSLFKVLKHKHHTQNLRCSAQKRSYFSL